MSAPITGCLVYYAQPAGANKGDIFLLPLPDGEPVALSQIIPSHKNALRYKTPGFCWDLKFSSLGNRFLFLADEHGESQLEALKQAYLTTEVMRLFAADLWVKWIWELQVAGERWAWTPYCYVR